MHFPDASTLQYHTDIIFSKPNLQYKSSMNDGYGHYLNIVVHGQVCDGMVVWNSDSAVLWQHSTWKTTKNYNVY